LPAILKVLDQRPRRRKEITNSNSAEKEDVGIDKVGFVQSMPAAGKLLTATILHGD
jgi:hypothetical protein